MLSKLSRQIDQDLEVLKASISELKLPLNSLAELERLRLSSPEINETMRGFGRNLLSLTNQK